MPGADLEQVLTYHDHAIDLLGGEDVDHPDVAAAFHGKSVTLHRLVSHRPVSHTE